MSARTVGRAPAHALSAVLSIVLLAAWPEAAQACPMCFTGNNSNADAFVWGSLFLMFVPVSVIGGLLYWAYRRSRAAEARQQPPRAEGRPQPGLRVVRR